MEALVKRRGILKSRLTVFKNYIVKITSSFPDPTKALEEIKRLEIRERLNNIREVYKGYDEIQTAIDELTSDEREAQYRETFEEEYFSLVAKAEGLLVRGARTMSAVMDETRDAMPIPGMSAATGDTNHIPGIAMHPNQNVIFKQPGIRLPTIELPKFKGDIDEWLGFRDTFESLIHNNETIEPIQKFHYMKAALEGTAAQIIKSLEFTAVNYAIAWETICNRFNNKGLLTYNHIKAIFCIPSIKEESATQIRNILDTLNKHLRALNALGQSTEHWDALLIYLASSKLDSSTAREWEKQRVDKDLPTLEEFKTFLSSRASLLETLELSKKGAHKFKQSEFAKSKSFLVQEQKCAVCKEAHRLSNCPKFLQFSPQKRAEVLRNAKLCLNCMKPGHYIKNCKAGACKKCSGKHNTLVHFEKTQPEQSTDSKEVNDSTSVLCSHNKAKNYQVLLSTAIILVQDKHGKKHRARAILDPGSQSSLITNKLCEELQLEKTNTNINLEAINSTSCEIKHKCEIKVAARHGNYEFCLPYHT